MASVRLDGLVKRFDSPEGTIVANDDIDLTVEDGEFLVIVGPSGSGKSTAFDQTVESDTCHVCDTLSRDTIIIAVNGEVTPDTGRCRGIDETTASGERAGRGGQSMPVSALIPSMRNWPRKYARINTGRTVTMIAADIGETSRSEEVTYVETSTGIVRRLSSVVSRNGKMKLFQE